MHTHAHTHTHTHTLTPDTGTAGQNPSHLNVTHCILTGCAVAIVMTIVVFYTVWVESHHTHTNACVQHLHIHTPTHTYTSTHTHTHTHTSARSWPSTCTRWVSSVTCMLWWFFPRPGIPSRHRNLWKIVYPTGFSTRTSFQKLSGILLEGGGD